MTSDINDPKATSTGLAPAETPAIEPVRGPAPVETVTPTKAAIVALALEWWPVVALIASAAMLATAHAFETFGKLYPCPLCLKQREVFWVAGAVALIGLASRYSPWAARLRRPFDLLLGAFFHPLGAIQDVGAGDVMFARTHQRQFHLVLHILDMESAARRLTAQQRAHHVVGQLLDQFTHPGGRGAVAAIDRQEGLGHRD